MYEHRLAYRYATNEVEGFVGIASTKKVARQDAIEQISRKIRFVQATRPDEPEYDKSRLIESPSRLHADELDRVQRDWRAGWRY